uniref:RNase H type-1 domain-containing protein n=2 Tax=Manihot esculenta TaxID=3983 RepID=A0A2C9UWS2_MANES
MEWSLAYDVSSVAPSAHASTDYSTAHWSRSPVGYVKCNFDASVPLQGQGVGLGRVLRDHCDHFIHVGKVYREGSFNPLIAEALAAREVLLYPKSSEFHLVVLDTLLVNAITTCVFDFSHLDLLVQYIDNLLSEIDDVPMVFARKSVNLCIHVLVRAVVFCIRFG